MGGIILRRSGAFVVAVVLAIAAFVVIAPQARSQMATVQVGACETGAAEALVTVTIVENVHAVDIIDSDGVSYYFAHPGGSQVFPVGTYDFIVFRYDDPAKTPLEQGSFEIACPSGTTTVPSETTVPVETTAPPVETTVPPTETTVPPTETTVPPTETTVPPVETTVPPTETTAPPTETTNTVLGTTITTVPPVSATTLPYTGAPLEATAMLGTVALLGGTLMLIGTRPRRKRPSGETIGSW